MKLLVSINKLNLNTLVDTIHFCLLLRTQFHYELLNFFMFGNSDFSHVLLLVRLNGLSKEGR